MPTTTPYPDPAARATELLRLHLFLDQPDLTLDAVRLYVLDRLDQVYPLDYLVYRRRWHALRAGGGAGAAAGVSGVVCVGEAVGGAGGVCGVDGGDGGGGGGGGVEAGAVGGGGVRREVLVGVGFAVGDFGPAEFER